MDFALPEETRLLQESLGRFLQDRYPLARRHEAASLPFGYDPATWAAFAELGAIAALFPEEAGGLGGTGLDIATVFEALGRALVTEPFLATLMAGTVLASAGRADLLAPAIEGKSRIAFAHYEPGARYDHTQVETRAEGGWRLTGAKAVVPNGGEADTLVVSAHAPAGLALFLVEAGAPGLVCRSTPTIDGLRVAEITLDATPATLLAEGAEPLVEDAIAAGLLALSAEALGAMEIARDTTLAYLGTRRQFGVPIGSFQALQHRMADLMIDIEQIRSAVINAAAAFEAGGTGRDRALAAAKHMAGRVGRRLAEEAIQMHGGMGMTWEYPIGHYAKRLVMIDHCLGDARHHLERFAGIADG
ncbi:MAG TPA: acyl-CoA dehydrogenase family protein [Paracoccaceae bacterium]|nr:acyl-CoA dehydrogenase family protein [Paracoccaceae bacterium]